MWKKRIHSLGSQGIAHGGTGVLTAQGIDGELGHGLKRMRAKLCRQLKRSGNKPIPDEKRRPALWPLQQRKSLRIQAGA